jgi:hypothetical protein
MTTFAPAAAPTDPQAARGASAPMPRLWARFSVRAGTAIQAAGITVGAAALATAAHWHVAGGLRLALTAAGWLAIYLSSHAVAHVAVGRAAGIRFRAYGVRGTDHPENYPPGVRQLMSVLPMWSALTDKASMRQAGRWAKAAMFAAGETSTIVVSIAAAAYAARTHTPGGHALLAGSILWAIAATITTAIVPKGDYAKALRALGWRKTADAKPVPATRERTTGPGRRGPRGHELRNAVAGWSVVNLALIAAWAGTGAGFPWFAFILVPSVIGVGSWARQGHRETAAR